MIKSPSSQTSSKKQAYFLKNKRNKSQHNLSTSGLSNKSRNFFDNGVKLSDSYYNDRQQIYLTRSRALSQKSISYQSKQISYSNRKKYNSKKIQDIVQKRELNETSNLGNKTMSLPSMKFLNRETIKGRINSLNARKFSQLVTRTKPIQRNIKFVEKEAKKKLEESSRQNKWSSPFRDTNSFKAKFEGKDLIPKKLSGIMSNSNTNQLKILNIDRMFRVKNGKLSNVIPIPLVKLSSVSSRPNVIKTIKKKDTIHQVIQQYNKLIKISQMQKTVKKIGIRGQNFTKPPTLQQLMGIKVHEYQKQKLVPAKQQQQLSEQIFINYTQYYQKHMKKDIHLARRIISGIKRQGKLNLQAFTRFYSIFVNKIALLEEKIKFLLYFFIPFGQQKIQLGVLKLILQVMCEQLPQISNLKAQSQFLTQQQKSKIFMQALNRVLFADIKQYVGSGEVLINRSILEMILQRNQDAVSLLIRLLVIE